MPRIKWRPLKRDSSLNDAAQDLEVEETARMSDENVNVSEKGQDKKATSGKRKADARSKVWSFFDKLDGNSSKCLLCEKNIKTSGNTTNLINHVMRIHPDDAKSCGISFNRFQDPCDSDEGMKVVEKVNGNANTPKKKKVTPARSAYSTPAKVSYSRPTFSSSASRSEDSCNRVSEELMKELKRLKHFVDDLQKPDDEFTQFGRYIATQMRNLCPEDAYEALREVHGIVLQKKLFAHKRDQQSDESYPPMFTYTVRTLDHNEEPESTISMVETTVTSVESADESESVVETETVAPEDVLEAS